MRGGIRLYFYPRPPRGGRRPLFFFHVMSFPFLSTPSARRATRSAMPRRSTGIDFYPRPPRGGRPPSCPCPQCQGYFYPRPPRGGRRSTCCPIGRQNVFLSTPSARRATSRSSFRSRPVAYFYPRPPRGGRPLIAANARPPHRFLSTPSARRATAKTETKSLFSNKLYNILHEFRRALIYNGSKSYPNHAK